jgi:hypothetical protein
VPPSEDRALPSGRWADEKLVIGLVLGLLCLPIVLDLSFADERRAFRYLAADAFLYLAVARNFVEFGQFTLDQAHSTNGFHPLWQWMLTGIFSLSAWVGALETTILALTILSNVVLTAVGVFFLGRAAAVEKRLTPAFLMLPLGVYALLISAMWWSLTAEGLAGENLSEGPMPLYGSLWSYANGMESSIVILLFGLAVYLYCKKPLSTSAPHAFVFGLVLSGITLGRLDHGIFSVALIAALVFRAWLERDRGAWRCIGFSIIGFALPLGLYCAGNLWFYGNAVPVSGRLKSTFPIPTSSSLDAIELIVQQMKLGQGFLNGAWRQAQILVPAAAAVLFACWAVRIRRSSDSGGLELRLRESSATSARMLPLILTTAPAVLALALYNYLFVRRGAQGHWYFPVSTLYVSLAAMVVLANARSLRFLARGGRGALVWSAAWVGLSIFYFVELAVPDAYHEKYVRFYFEEAPLVRAHFGDRPPKLLSHDDGIVAFGTGFPTMQFSGFTGDAEVAAQKNRMFEFAVSRGHDHYTSLVYENFDAIRLGAPSPQVRAWMVNNVRQLQNPDDYDITLAYRAKDLGFAIIRVRPRPGIIPVEADH